MAPRRLRSGVASLASTVLVLLSIENASAGPASPVVMTLRQPDGSTFEARSWGDEYENGHETVAGHTVVRDPASGAWVYAARDAGGRLVASEAVVGVSPPASAWKLRPTPSGPKPSVRALLSEPITAAVAPPAYAIQRMLVIVVDFTPSLSRGVPEEEFARRFFASGSASVADYWSTVSHGRLSIRPAPETSGVANDGVVLVTLAHEFPDTCRVAGRADEIVGQCRREAAVDAINAADHWVNFASFDVNRDGYLNVSELHLMIVLRGTEASAGACEDALPSTWGHRTAFAPNAAPRPDGVAVGDVNGGPPDAATRGGYMQEGEWHQPCGHGPGHPATMGVAVHELGHDLGLPDLYDEDGTSAGVGVWSSMAAGTWGHLKGQPSGSRPVSLDAYSRSLLGYVDPEPIGTSTYGLAVPTASLATGPGHGVFMVPGDPATHWEFDGCTAGTGEYFLLENRQPVAYDESLPGHGLLIWHVFEAVAGCRVNDDEGTPERPGTRLLALEQADGAFDLECFGDAACRNYGDAGDPWSGAGALFSPDSSPNSRYHSGDSSNVTVALETGSQDVMTIDVLLPRCGDGLIEGGEGCDDGDAEAGDGCAATCAEEPCWACTGGSPSSCAPLDAVACDDGNACTEPDVCVQGTCTAGRAKVCNVGHACARDTCDPTTGCILDLDDGRCALCESCREEGCVAGPRRHCAQSLGRSKLLVRDSPRDEKDRLIWRWGRGAVPLRMIEADGEPQDYALCMFAEERTTFEAVVPAGASCGDGRCWTERKTSLLYDDRDARNDGIARLKLAAGSGRGGAVAVLGRGSDLPPLDLPLALPTTVQLQQSGGNCWSTTFQRAQRSTDTRFKGWGRGDPSD